MRQVLSLAGCDHVDSYCGQNLYICPDYTMPNKRHIKNKNMTEAYHRRIQKKWNKRFGVCYSSMLEDGSVLEFRQANAIVMNRNSYNKLKRGLHG